MDGEYLNLKIMNIMKDNGKMDIDMELECIFGKMEIYI
jgi:hypothetical protein